MNKSVKEIKSLAKGQLIGRYKPAILAGLLVAAIEFIVTSIAEGASSAATAGGYLMFLVINIIIDLLCGILILGECCFYLKFVRFDSTVSIRDVFYGFKNNMDKAILVQAVFTVVSLIGSAPAILINLELIDIPEENIYILRIGLYAFQLILMFVAKLYLGLSFYILCDHPEYSVKEIFTASLNLMSNKKGRLILIYLSLIPLLFLGFFAFAIGLLWVIALQQTMLADFYLLAIGEPPAIGPKLPESDHPDYSTSDMH